MADKVEYMGDGVYVSFDGYMLKLMANSHKEPTDVIYIEPAVWATLVKYVEGLKEKE